MKQVILLVFVLIAGLPLKAQEKTIDLSKYKVIDMPHSPYIHFLKDGKMGLAVENQKNNTTELYLEPEYDFVATVPLGTGVFTLKNGVLSHYIPEEERVLITATNSLVYDFQSRQTEELICVDDKKVYSTEFTEEGDQWIFQKEYKGMTYGKFEMRRYGNKLLVQSDNVNWDQEWQVVMSTEYPGEDSIDADGNVVYYPKEGGNMAGVYDLDKKDWLLDPNHIWIKKMKRGFLAFPDGETINGEYVYPGFTYLDKAFNILLKNKIEEEMSHADSLLLLPDDSRIIDLTREMDAHYVTNGKMGVMEYQINWVSEVDHVAPKYDVVGPRNFLHGYLTYNEGKFDMVSLAGWVGDYPSLPTGARQSVELGKYDSRTIVTLDGKRHYELKQREDNPDLMEWVKATDLPDLNNPQPSASLKKTASTQVLVTIDAFEYPEAMMSQMYPGEDSIDAYGDVVYYPGGDVWSQFYDLQKNDYVGTKYGGLNKVEGGYIAWLWPETNSSIGVINEELQTVLPFEFDKVHPADGCFITTKDELEGVYKLNGETLIEPGDYAGIEYKDGYFFSPVLKKFSEWLYSEGYEEGKVEYYKELLCDKNGTPIDCPYRGQRLLEDGILVIQDTALTEDGHTLIGYYDLKNSKLIAPPEYRDFRSGDDFTWLQHKGKWSLYKTGASFAKIGEEEYDEIIRVDRDQNLLYTRNNGLEGLIQIDGKVLLEPKYKMEKTRYVAKDQFRIQLYSEGEKHGAFELTTRRHFLPPEYEDLVFNRGQILAIKKNRKWGAIDHSTIKDDLSYTLKLEAKYDGKPWKVNNYYAMTDGKQYGVIGQDGSVMIPLQYDNIIYHDVFGKYPEFDSVFIVVNKTGNAETKGLYIGHELVLPLEYSNIDFEIGKHVMLQKQVISGTDTIQKYGEYDVKARQITLEPIYDGLFNAYGKKDWVWVEKDGKFAAYSMYGDKLSDFDFTAVLDQINQKKYLWTVKTDQGVGLYDLKKQKYAIEPIYDEINTHDGDLTEYWQMHKDNKVGLLDPADNSVIYTTDYDRIYVKNGLLFAEKNDLYTILREPSYYSKNPDEMDTILDGVKLYKALGSVLLVSQNGQNYLCQLDNYDTLIPCDYDELYLASEDAYPLYYITKKNGLSGLISIDDSLVVLTEPKYDVLEYFEDDLFIVGKHNSWSYLDKTPKVGVLSNNGELIVPVEYKVNQHSYGNWVFEKDGVYLEYDIYSQEFGEIKDYE